jgi:tetratricopeptide (TPR) repeat protein
MMDSAIVLYEKILEEKPIDLVSYFRLKDLYFLKKKYKLVVNNAKLALRDYPNNFKLYIDVGNGYMLLNDTINGLKYFNIALTKDPNNFGLKKSIENMEKLHN